MWQATTVFLVKERKGRGGGQTHYIVIGSVECPSPCCCWATYICRDCSTLLNLMESICTVLTVSVQEGWNATQVAAYWGHLSLTRELVDTYHGTVHRKAEVM